MGNDRVPLHPPDRRLRLVDLAHCWKTWLEKCMKSVKRLSCGLITNRVPHELGDTYCETVQRYAVEHWRAVYAEQAQKLRYKQQGTVGFS